MQYLNRLVGASSLVRDEKRNVKKESETISNKIRIWEQSIFLLLENRDCILHFYLTRKYHLKKAKIALLKHKWLTEFKLK